MVETTAETGPRWLRGPLRPFRRGRYRWLAGSLTMSMFAAGVWLIAVVWQVIALGGGPGQLSVVAAAAASGMMVTSLLGGVLADRVPQRRILLAVAAGRAVAVGVVAVLAVAGGLDLWHLVAASLVIGFANGFTYPAYSALLPTVLPAEELMAANGVEGMLRPTVMQAAGPAVASAVIAASSPGAALLVVAAFEVVGGAFLLAMRPVPARTSHGQSAGADQPTDAAPPAGASQPTSAAPPAGMDQPSNVASADGAGQPPSARNPVRAVLTDLWDGFRYMGRTPWLLATLLFASVLILLIMGPIEVLIPFAVKDRAGGGPGDHAVVMAAFGIGGALGSLGMASLRMPRRYLTVMNLFWGAGCLPLALVGFATEIWVIAVALFLLGICFSAPMVIWGTLLQRRVPPHLLGRVASLDFFVSLVFMPVSMALAGPVAAGIGLEATFVLAGTLPTLLAVLALVLARLPQDELAHPLDQASTAPGSDDESTDLIDPPPTPAAATPKPESGAEPARSGAPADGSGPAPTELAEPTGGQVRLAQTSRT